MGSLIKKRRKRMRKKKHKKLLKKTRWQRRQQGIDRLRVADAFERPAGEERQILVQQHGGDGGDGREPLEDTHVLDGELLVVFDQRDSGSDGRGSARGRLTDAMRMTRLSAMSGRSLAARTQNRDKRGW